jgi:hypothetical protein
MLIKALEMGVCIHRDPVFGNKGGDAPFLRPSTERSNLFCIRKPFVEVFERYVKEGSGNGATPSIGDPRSETCTGFDKRNFLRNL